MNEESQNAHTTKLCEGAERALLDGDGVAESQEVPNGGASSDRRQKVLGNPGDSANADTKARKAAKEKEHVI